MKCFVRISYKYLQRYFSLWQSFFRNICTFLIWIMRGSNICIYIVKDEIVLWKFESIYSKYIFMILGFSSCFFLVFGLKYIYMNYERVWPKKKAYNKAQIRDGYYHKSRRSYWTLLKLEITQTSTPQRLEISTFTCLARLSQGCTWKKLKSNWFIFFLIWFLTCFIGKVCCLRISKIE